MSHKSELVHSYSPLDSGLAGTDPWCGRPAAVNGHWALVSEWSRDWRVMCVMAPVQCSWKCQTETRVYTIPLADLGAGFGGTPVPSPLSLPFPFPTPCPSSLVPSPSFHFTCPPISPNRRSWTHCKLPQWDSHGKQRIFWQFWPL